MRIGRFERKILMAITAVAAVPLVGALLLGRQVLVEAYGVGINPRMRGQLEQAVETYRAHFVALRDGAENAADAVSGDWRLVEAVEAGDAQAVRRTLESAVARYGAVVRIEVRDAGGATVGSAERAGALGTKKLRLLELSRTVGRGPAQANVTVATPRRPFDEQQRAADVLQVFSKLQEGSGYISGRYLAVYSAFLLTVIVAAFAAGLTLSRRVTRRVAVLAQATGRVGAGDLTVEVPVESHDEIAELTRAFNDMVRDMRESRERIEYLQRIGAWQEFARRLAHEIKNPLTPIQLAVQEVHRAYDGPDDKYRRIVEEARSIVEEEVATLRRLVGEFSAFAKLPEASLGPADLGDFVRDAARAIALAEANGDDGEPRVGQVSLEYEIAQEAMPVYIDAMMLKRCLDNLVRNAAHALRDAGRPGKIVVAACLSETRAVLSVRDDGPGVPADARSRVFDPYYTTKADGTGLGLAIVKKVVLEHGGEVTCGASPEGGAVFRIVLPMGSARRG